jgi:hypothetical protein
MPIKMKALKDFRGRPGEGNTGRSDRVVETGVEFGAADQKRADWLESQGLAVPMFVQKAATVPLNKMEPAPANKAAAAGPLDLIGGRTGAPSDASSLSPPDRVQPPPRSNRRGGRQGS